MMDAWGALTKRRLDFSELHSLGERPMSKNSWYIGSSSIVIAVCAILVGYSAKIEAREEAPWSPQAAAK